MDSHERKNADSPLFQRDYDAWQDVNRFLDACLECDIANAQDDESEDGVGGYITAGEIIDSINYHARNIYTILNDINCKIDKLQGAAK
jgi:hypothetical protein